MDYYGYLNVSRDATADEIKSAYKALIKKYHPDVFSGDKAVAEKKMSEIISAYGVLSDDKRRSDYDCGLKLADEMRDSEISEPFLQPFGFHASPADNADATDSVAAVKQHSLKKTPYDRFMGEKTGTSAVKQRRYLKQRTKWQIAVAALVSAAVIVLIGGMAAYFLKNPVKSGYENLPEYTVNFIAGSGGRIEGKTRQLVKKGKNTEAVKAIPSAGYRFAGWRMQDGGFLNGETITRIGVQMDETWTAEFSLVGD
jgi:hypothetical protein